MIELHSIAKNETLCFQRRAHIAPMPAIIKIFNRGVVGPGMEVICKTGFAVRFIRVDNRARLIVNAQTRRASQSNDAQPFDCVNVPMRDCCCHVLLRVASQLLPALLTTLV